MQEILTCEKKKYVLTILLEIPPTMEGLRSSKLSNEEHTVVNLKKVNENFLKLCSKYNIDIDENVLIAQNGNEVYISFGVNNKEDVLKIIDIAKNIDHLIGCGISINGTQIKLNSKMFPIYYVEVQRPNEPRLHRVIVIEKISNTRFTLKVLECENCNRELSEIISEIDKKSLEDWLLPKNIVYPETKYYLVFETNNTSIRHSLRIEIKDIQDLMNIFNQMLIKIVDMGSEDIPMELIKKDNAYNIIIRVHESIIEQLKEIFSNRIKEFTNIDLLFGSY